MLSHKHGQPVKYMTTGILSVIWIFIRKMVRDYLTPEIVCTAILTIEQAILSKFNESHPLTPVAKVGEFPRYVGHIADSTDLRLWTVRTRWCA